MLALFSITLTACLNSDHREPFATGLLYPPSDPCWSAGDAEGTSAGNRALAGAVLGRFPLNTSAGDLRKFLLGLGSFCSDTDMSAGKDGSFIGFTCSFDETSGIFGGEIRNFHVRTNAGKIAGIVVSKSVGACYPR
jgi:hypothetical protein